MKEKLLNNLGNKVLAIVLAILLWLVVVNMDNPYVIKTYSDIEVELQNKDVITSANKAMSVIEGDKVNVTIKAKRKVIDNLQKSDIHAVADLSKLSWLNAVPIEVYVTKYADRIAEKSLGRVNTLKVSIEDNKKKQFPVVVETTGQVGYGYAVGNKIATPNIVDVSGPASLINKIKEVRVTVSVQGAKKDQKVEIKPVFYSYDGEKMDSSLLKCGVDTVAIRVDLLKTKKVGLDVQTKGSVADGYRIAAINYEPKTVTVAGSDDALSDLINIVVQDLNVDGKNKDVEKTVDITKYLPKGILLAQDSSEVMVTVKIEALGERSITFTQEDVQVNNTPENLDIAFDQEQGYSVLIQGLPEEIKELTIKDLNPIMDLSGLKKGTHSIEVQFEQRDDITYRSKVKIKLVARRKTEDKTTKEPERTTKEEESAETSTTKPAQE